jgi:hypothetical protein
MAKINNTTVYPNIIPTANDYVVLTDVTDSDQTKTATVAAFQLFFGITTLEVTLTSAQLLNSFTNPVTLVPAQGAGTYIIPQGQVIAKYNYNTTVYDFANDGFLGPAVGVDNYFLWDNATFLNAASNNIWVGAASNNTNPLIGAENTDLLFFTTASNPTQGDGTLDLSFQYKVITI